MVTVLFVEDSLHMIKGVQYSLEPHNYELLIAVTYTAACALIDQAAFQVALLDIHLTTDDRAGRGLELFSRIRTRTPQMGVVFHSAHDSCLPKIRQMMETGIRSIAFLSKSASPEELLTALQVVQRGDNYMDARLTSVKFTSAGQRLLDSIPSEYRHWVEKAYNHLPSLTEAQLKVVALDARGLTHKQIGSQLYISTCTVDSHKRNAYKCLVSLMSGGEEKAKTEEVYKDAGISSIVNNALLLWGSEGRLPRLPQDD